MSINVHLERFEGPLGLLLHLIREQEMDIFNINIQQITHQYLEYIKTMRKLDLEVAGEFVAMAATLLQIKSRMLLPNYNEEGEEVATEDPRKELVQKLLEYKKFKELSVDLYKRPLLGRDVFTRGERTEIESLDEAELVLEDNPLYALIFAYRLAVKNMKKTFHRVVGELQSIAARILEMKELFVPGQRIVFSQLITDTVNPSGQVLVTFLSLLELAKMGFISVFQSEPFADIHIDPKRSIDRDIVSQVESYDSVHAAEKAEEIMSEAQMSLEETTILGEDEIDVNEPAPVQESFADAASDDEIFAEEQRLAAEDMAAAGIPVVEEVAPQSPLAAAIEDFDAETLADEAEAALAREPVVESVSEPEVIEVEALAAVAVEPEPPPVAPPVAAPAAEPTVSEHLAALTSQAAAALSFFDTPTAAPTPVAAPAHPVETKTDETPEVDV